MRAAALVRVSTTDQAESGWGLPEQRGAIGAYCRRHGIDLVEMCEDEGVSGRMTERPAVRRVMELARAGSINAVVLVKLDRLGRDNRVIQELLHRFRALGLEVRFVDHGSGDTASDRLLLNVLGGVSEFEMEMIRARTMAGRRRKAESGRLPNAFNLFGFHMVRVWEELADPTQSSGTLRVIPEEAEVVLDLFTRYDQGESMGSLVRWLNASGRVTRRGNEWRVGSLRLMMLNTAYRGEARYGWRAVSSYMERNEDGGERKRFRVEAQEDWITIPCPVIVPPDLWRRVEARIAEVASSIGRPSLVWPLRGCVRCGVCVGKMGIPLVATGQRKCSNPRRDGYKERTYRCRGCNATITADRWEQKALRVLRESVRPGVQAEAARARVEAQRRALGDVDAVIAKHQAALRELDEEERRLLAAAVHFSEHIIAEQASRIRQKRQAASEAMQTAIIQQHRVEDPERAATQAEERAARVRARIDDAEDDLGEMQALFRDTIRITIRKRKTALIEVNV